MDMNKAQKLRDIGYEIGPTCGQCVHGVFSSRDANFGECLVHSYEHQKHSGGVRRLSVYRQGHCPSFQRAEALIVAEIHGFKEFLK